MTTKNTYTFTHHRLQLAVGDMAIRGRAPTLSLTQTYPLRSHPSPSACWQDMPIQSKNILCYILPGTKITKFSQSKTITSGSGYTQFFVEAQVPADGKKLEDIHNA